MVPDIPGCVVWILDATRWLSSIQVVWHPLQYHLPGKNRPQFLSLKLVIGTTWVTGARSHLATPSPNFTLEYLLTVYLAGRNLEHASLHNRKALLAMTVVLNTISSFNQPLTRPVVLDKNSVSLGLISPTLFRQCRILTSLELWLYLVYLQRPLLLSKISTLIPQQEG
jgi:hypothetical protein